MAEAILLGVASHLDIAMSKGRLQLEQLGCLDRLAVLHIEPSCTGRIVAPEAIHDSQLPFKLGALLGRTLEQRHDSRVGWQNVNFCSMVRKAAMALSVVLNLARRFVPAQAGFCSQDPVIAQQLAASGLMPKLAEVLPGLAAAVEAATEPHTCLPAARGVLVAVFSILFVWPGQTGVLSSKAAGPLVQPTLHLIVAVVQHVVVTKDASAFEAVADTIIPGIPYLAWQVLVQTDRFVRYQQQKGQQQPQKQNFVEAILSSPVFLTVLMTVTCMIHYPGSVAEAISDTVPDRAATVAADPAASVEQHDRGGCSTRPGAELRHAGATGVSALENAEQQQQAELGLQLALFLQDLYGQSDTSSTWHRLLSSSAVVRCAGWFDNNLLWKVLPATTECIQQASMQLQRAVACVNEQHQTCLPLPQQQLLCLHALRQLPLLLLGPLFSASAQAATRTASACGVCRASLGLIEEVIRCWKLQLELQSTCAGVQVEQLPCAKLLRLLLQQMNVLQQLRSEAAAAPAPAPAQSTADGASTNLGSSTTAAGAASAAAVEAVRVRELDVAMVELLKVLTQLQNVSQYAVWQPHIHQVAAVVERCLRSTSSSTRSDHQHDANALFAHHNLCTVCNSFLHLEHKSFQLADGEGSSEEIVFGALLGAAATATPSTHEQQQLFTLLISLLKSSSHWQQSGLAACQLEYPQVTVSKIVNRVFRHMLNVLWSDSSNNPSAAAELPHGMPCGKVLCAAAPWLVASSRLVCHATAQLAKCVEALEGQLHATAADESYSSSGGDISSSEAAQSASSTDAAEQVVGNHLRRVLYCNECVLCSVMHWVGTLEDCCRRLQASCNGTDGSSSSIGTDQKVEVVGNVGTSTTTATTQTVLVGVHDAVQDLQQAQLQEACRALQSEPGSATPSLWDLGETGLTELQGVCHAACPKWQQETEAGKHVQWSVSASRATFDVDLFKHVLEQYNIKQLLRDLTGICQCVCAALPLRACCNNPLCRNVSGRSEWALVSGKGCVCAGCGTARYCSKECQVAHWPWHKAICKAIKKQSRAQQQA